MMVTMRQVLTVFVVDGAGLVWRLLLDVGGGCKAVMLCSPAGLIWAHSPGIKIFDTGLHSCHFVYPHHGLGTHTSHTNP